VRVSVVGPAHPFKGGAVLHTTELAHRLAAAGHDTVVESWSAQYPKLLYPGQLTVDVPEMPLFEPTRRTLSWRRPVGWFRQGRRIGAASDVVIFQLHSTTAQAIPYLAIIRGARSAGARIVLIANNVVPHEARAIDRVLARLLYRRADLILVHGDELAGQVAEFAPTPVVVAALPPHLPRPVVAVGPATDPSAVHDQLLFFGLIRPYKGVDVLVRALAGAGVSARLVVAGEVWGGGSGELRALIAEHGLGQRVDFREGYVEAAELPGLFAASDALVLPYRHATGSQNAQLAFEYDRPVIVTKTGALADAVTDGVDGIVCAPDDVASLTDAIERFYAPGEALRLRANVKRPDATPAWNAYVDALLTGARNRVAP
jgi:glycosyltransferase involved in cell wall biosynthesis